MNFFVNQDFLKHKQNMLLNNNIKLCSGIGQGCILQGWRQKRK